MTFLYPNFLWLLSLASVPIILHLLSRIRLRRVNFSALYFLKDVKRERFSWLRLKEILLLIFRTLLIIFLFLALARPKLQGKIFPVKRLANIVIILDDSYSMGYGPNFENAKKEAKQILGQLSAGSEVIILTSTQKTGSNGFYQGKNLKAAASYLDSSFVSNFSSDLNQSLIRAQTELEKSNFADKEIFIISDEQKRAFLPILQNFKLKFPASVIEVGGGQENCAVTAVFLSERFPTAARPVKIGAKIKNYTKHEITQNVVLSIVDKTETKQLKLVGGEEKSLLFESEVSSRGQYSGSVRIEFDSLKTDDQRYFDFFIPEEIPVLLVYGQAADVFYLKRALAPESSNTFNVVTTEEKVFRQKNLSNFAVIGVINPTNFTRSDWQRLDYYTQKGGKVFIALGNEPKDKAGLARFCDYELLMKPAGFVSIDRVQFDHPIFEIFTGIDLTTTQFRQWAKLKPNRTKVLAAFSDGSPYILESEDKNYILTSSAFGLDASDIVFRPIFLPLIQRIFFYLAEGDVKTEYEVGATIGTAVSTAGLVKVKTPKEEYSVMPDIIGDQRVITLKETNLPGIYHIGEKSWALNINTAESDLSRVKESEIIRAGFRISKEGLTRATDLSGFFLYLAFFALALEMALLLV